METFNVTVRLYDKADTLIGSWSRENVHAPFTAISDIYFQIGEETDVLAESVVRHDVTVRRV